MEFSRARDVTAQYQELRNAAMCNSEHGLVRPVEIVDVSAVISRTETGDWFTSGRPILVVYGTDPREATWCARLQQPFPDGGSVEIGFAVLGKPLYDGNALVIQRNVGLTLAQVAELYLACVPDRIKRSVRDSGVAI